MTDRAQGVSPRHNSAAKTRKVTLHRLSGVAPDMAAMRGLFEEAELERQGITVHSSTIAGMPAIVLAGMRGGERPPEWQSDASATTGLELELRTTTPALTVVVAVDGTVYAFSYGDGHRLIQQRWRDPEFGRMFAACALDSTAVATVDTRDMGSVNRYDSTHIPDGEEITTYGLRHERELVNRIRATCGLRELTAAREGNKPRFADCGDGIRTQLGVEQSDLVNDIRFIAATVEEGQVKEGMRFLKDRKEVRSPCDIDLLWSLFESGLRDPESIGLAISPPQELLEEVEQARAFRIRLGPATCPLRRELRVSDLVARLRHLREGTVAQSLKEGWIRTFEDADGTRVLGKHTNLQKWISASVQPGNEIYTLREGHWYQYGPRYVAEVQDKVAQLLTAGSSVHLPAWSAPPTDGRNGTGGEHGYNRHIADTQPGYLCLDRRLARTSVHTGKGVEMCDVLGPENELICVKQASSASELSHLFTQARAGAESLCYEAEARAWFARRVAELDPQRDLTGFRPKKVVFGIRLTKHSEINVDTLYPLNQVELYSTTVALEKLGIDVEVVPIRN